MQTASTKDVVFLCLSFAASLLLVLVLRYDDLRLVILEESSLDEVFGQRPYAHTVVVFLTALIRGSTYEKGLDIILIFT